MSVASDPPAVSESFGRRLRRERERRQIALASIAENTKISVSLFEDLERDDVARWPSGIYRRSFIRAYADAIGLDADATTREFVERFPDPNAPACATHPPSSTAVATAAHAPSALRLTLADTSSSSFVGGRLLASARSRCAAVACDAAVILVLGGAMYLVLGTLWMPLAIALAGYYAGGILLLGNSPGVCLCAPGNRTNAPSNRNKPVRPVWTEARSMLAALRNSGRERVNALSGRMAPHRRSAPPAGANSTVPS
jgi:transcriptional regulator with XRE-family HTH domain